MPVVLYTETNFLLSYATGRSSATDSLLAGTPSPVRIAIPGPCFMEALTVLEDERKRWSKFAQPLETEIIQARRNLASPRIQAFIGHLQASLVEFQSISSDFEARLFHAMVILSSRATLIDPTAAIIHSSTTRRVVADPTDNLILTCILAHAEASGPGKRAFLTENRRCFFDDPYAKSAITSSGIKFFSDASKCLAWLSSRSAT
jgi:hypothetical protein